MHEFKPQRLPKTEKTITDLSSRTPPQFETVSSTPRVILHPFNNQLSPKTKKSDFEKTNNMYERTKQIRRKNKLRNKKTSLSDLPR